MEKFFLVKFSDGATFAIPFKALAKLRTDYYAIQVDGHKENSPEYDEEFKYSLDNQDELVDWLCNNTNWEDVESFAILQKSKNSKANYSDEWLSGVLEGEPEVIEQ